MFRFIPVSTARRCFVPIGDRFASVKASFTIRLDGPSRPVTQFGKRTIINPFVEEPESDPELRAVNEEQERLECKVFEEYELQEFEGSKQDYKLEAFGSFKQEYNFKELGGFKQEYELQEFGSSRQEEEDQGFVLMDINDIEEAEEDQDFVLVDVNDIEAEEENDFVIV